ncbi:hypothetical protein M404DRAFT_21285 [Pisolithus tinctorius Marx 270]|uniref:Uncharacterized protein n=1 Tax=Pisolithus tinctorius Marx 270 TaxID=870435 RepID=A0A0C3P9T5_PISTI|nr:hypothetical protein M404DRAFT_21285 [Pisolithus tinctorius Marx 270]
MELMFVSWFFGLNVNWVKESPLFTTNGKDKMGLKVYLADPANYEHLGSIMDEDMSMIVEWGEVWSTKKSIMHVNGKYGAPNWEDPIILVNMMYPYRKWLEDGWELLITLKGKEQEA